MKKKKMAWMMTAMVIANVASATAEEIIFRVVSGQQPPQGVRVVTNAVVAVAVTVKNETSALADGLIKTAPTPVSTITPTTPIVVSNTVVVATSPSPIKGCSGHGWRHWWHRCACFVGIGVSANVSAGIVTGAYYPVVWEPNDSIYEARYYGVRYPDSVFSYGPRYNSYTYVDNYRSGPYPPVRFINETPRSQPYQSYGSHGGNHGGRRH